jgi:phage terminase large subunit GpA-like protein
MFDTLYDYDVPLADACALVCEAWLAAWTPPAKLTVSAYADAHRIIAKGSGAEPGPWRTARTPYLREIQDSLSAHCPVREVSFKKSAQIGATEVLINWGCYVIDHTPDAMIVAQPVKDLARSWASGKFDPAVALMPELAAKITSDNTLEKMFPGGTMWVIWANSSNQLRQRTARYIAMDEVNEYPDDLDGQGSADKQLEARALSYGDRGKIYRACTPTVAGKSKISKSYDEGDARHYLVRCPHCRQHFSFTEALLQDNGTFLCGHQGCGVEIGEEHKTAMLVERSACADCGTVPVRTIHDVGRNGSLIFADACECRYIIDPPVPDGAYHQPSNPEADPLHRSYHVWAAYTPEGLGLTWAEIAKRRAEAAADPTKQAGYTNLILGLDFEGERQSQDSTEVATLAEAGVNLGVVPRGGYILTAGVDCQHDRFEVQVIASGRGQRVRVVDYQVIDGDPSLPTGYEQLDAYLKRTFRNWCGVDMPILAVAIDGGNWTEMVAQYVKRAVSFSGNSRLIETSRGYQPQRVYLVRGRSEKKSDRAVYRPAKTEVNHRDRTIARSVGVWGVGTSVLKHMIYGWLSSAIVKREEANKAGEPEDIDARMLRFPGGRGEPHDPLKPDPGALLPTYYAGLTCEYFDLDAQQWIKPKGKANEPLDTLAYAIWAALSPAIKVDAMREPQWEALQAQLEPAEDDLFASQSLRPAPKAPDASRETSPPQPSTTSVASDAWSRRL